MAVIRSRRGPCALERVRFKSALRSRAGLASGRLPAEPGVAYPRCTGGRREAPPEDCGGIWAFNEQQADMADTFDADVVNERLAGLAAVLIPAR